MRAIIIIILLAENEITRSKHTGLRGVQVCDLILSLTVMGYLRCHDKKCSLAYGIGGRRKWENHSQEQIGAREEIIQLHSVTRSAGSCALLCATGGRSIWIACGAPLASWLLVVFGTNWRSEGGRKWSWSIYSPGSLLVGRVLATAASLCWRPQVL